MSNYRRFNNSEPTLKLLFNSAVARYNRQDGAGAANTINNAARNLIPNNEDGSNKINFYKLRPTEGTIEDAIKAQKEGNLMLALRVLKYIELGFHCGTFKA